MNMNYAIVKLKVSTNHVSILGVYSSKKDALDALASAFEDKATECIYQKMKANSVFKIYTKGFVMNTLLSQLQILALPEVKSQ